MTTLRPASPNEAPDELGPHVVLGLGERVGHQDALAGSQPVGLHDVQPGQRAQEGQRGIELVRAERAVRGRRHAGRHQDVLHPRLGASSRAPSAPGPEDQRAPGPQAIGQTVDQRHLGPDHVEVGVELLGGVGHRARDAGVARRHDHLRRAGQRDGQRVLPPSAPDDADPHGSVQLHVLVPPGTGTDVGHRDADLPLQRGQVVAGLAGQVGHLVVVRQVGLPTGQLLVHRRDVVEHALVVRHGA